MRTLLALLLASVAAQAADKPNIILIYSDDHGWADLGIQGSDQDIRTPHLDAMARDGVRFTRGYVSARNASPRARACSRAATSSASAWRTTIRARSRSNS